MSLIGQGGGFSTSSNRNQNFRRKGKGKIGPFETFRGSSLPFHLQRGGANNSFTGWGSGKEDFVFRLF